MRLYGKFPALLGENFHKEFNWDAGSRQRGLALPRGLALLHVNTTLGKHTSSELWRMKTEPGADANIKAHASMLQDI